MSNIKIEWHGDAIAAALEKELGESIKTSAIDLKSKSEPETPVAIGDLKGNCSVVYEDQVISAPKGGKSPESKISIKPPGTKLTALTGFSLPYALKQHEELGYHHEEGKAKYLEDPYNANKDIYIQKAANIIKEKLK